MVGVLAGLPRTLALPDHFGSPGQNRRVANHRAAGSKTGCGLNLGQQSRRLARLMNVSRTLLLMAFVCAASAQAPHIGNIDFYGLDRKSTRLNSSHRCISYAVF